MPDVKLHNTELTLSKNKEGAQALAFLSGVDEPGDYGRVDTIIFDDLHRGLGNELVATADRVRAEGVGADSAESFSTWKPGILMGSGQFANSSPPLTDRGPGENVRVVASSFLHGGDPYFILPKRAVTGTNGGDGTWSSVHTTTDYMSGPAAFYGGVWFIGLQTTAGYSAGHVEFDGSAWATKVGGSDLKANFFKVVHGGMFSIREESDGWDLRFTDDTPANATLDANWVIIVANQRGTQPTALEAIGRYVVVFGQWGEIILVADAPPVKSLMPRGFLADDDTTFANGAQMWGADLVFPSRWGLQALNIPSMAIRDISPTRLQGALGRRLFRPSAIASMGADLLVGTYSAAVLKPSVANDIPSLLLLRNYPEGPSYTHLTELNVALFAGAYRVQALAYAPTTGVVSMLIGDTAGIESYVYLYYMPSEANAKPKEAAGTSAIRLSSSYGPSPGRKLALQVRGWYADHAGLGTTIDVIADVDTLVEAGAVATNGPFTLTGARVLGDAFGLRLKLDLIAEGSDNFPRFILPLMLDYAEEPRSGDRIQIGVEVPTGPRRGDAGVDAPTELLATLQALRGGTTRTFSMLDPAGASASWTVIVEGVDLAGGGPKRMREFPEATIVVTMRVV